MSEETVKTYFSTVLNAKCAQKDDAYKHIVGKYSTRSTNNNKKFFLHTKRATTHVRVENREKKTNFTKTMYMRARTVEQQAFVNMFYLHAKKKTELREIKIELNLCCI